MTTPLFTYTILSKNCINVRRLPATIMHATSLPLLPRQDIFTNQEMKLGMQSSAGVKKIDFDEEARKLWERLGISKCVAYVNTYIP